MMIALNILFLFFFLHLHLYHSKRSLIFKKELCCFFIPLKILMIDQTVTNLFSFNFYAIRSIFFDYYMNFIQIMQGFFCILSFRIYRDLLLIKFCSYFYSRNFRIALDLIKFKEDLKMRSISFQQVFDHFIYSPLIFAHQVILIENSNSHKFPEYSKYFCF